MQLHPPVTGHSHILAIPFHLPTQHQCNYAQLTIVSELALMYSWELSYYQQSLFWHFNRTHVEPLTIQPWDISHTWLPKRNQSTCSVCTLSKVYRNVWSCFTVLCSIPLVGNNLLYYFQWAYRLILYFRGVEQTLTGTNVEMGQPQTHEIIHCINTSLHMQRTNHFVITTQKRTVFTSHSINLEHASYMLYIHVTNDLNKWVLDWLFFWGSDCVSEQVSEGVSVSLSEKVCEWVCLRAVL